MILPIASDKIQTLGSFIHCVIKHVFSSSCETGIILGFGHRALSKLNILPHEVNTLLGRQIVDKFACVHLDI